MMSSRGRRSTAEDESVELTPSSSAGHRPTCKDYATSMKLSLSIRHGIAQNNADRRATSQRMQDIHETVSVGSQTAMAMEGKAEATERPWEGGCRAKRRGNGVYTHIYRIASCQCQHRHHPLPTEGLILLPYITRDFYPCLCMNFYRIATRHGQPV